MPLRTALAKVLQEYPAAAATEFKGNAVAHFLRHDLSDLVKGIIQDFSATASDDYIVAGSAGQSQWTRCPWVAVFDFVVTDSGVAL